MEISLTKLLPWIPLLPLCGAIINGLFGKKLPRRVVAWIACGALLGAALISGLCLLATFSLPPRAKIQVSLFDWISVGDLQIYFRFTVDRLSAVMINVITWVGFLIHVYSVGYMSHDRSFSRYFTYLNLFVFSMLVLVLGDDLVVMFLGWEGVGLCSYLLIGFWFEDQQKAYAGRKAFVVNRIGDFGFLLGIFLLFFALQSAGGGGGSQGAPISLSFGFLEQASGKLSSGVVTASCLLLFLGAMGKSAQIPLYVWLPDAMAGPTPVSALIHAATMVTAGVYMVARLNFLYAASPFAQAWVTAFGTATALWAATIAITQKDIKKILAYSTVSQLGYMFMGVGLGAATAGVFHLVTHAFFKAALFLGAGSVMHALAGNTDIWKMGGLFKRMPVTSWVMLSATLAIMGMIPFAGFFSKDAVLLAAFYNNSVPGGIAYWVVGLITAGLTSFYMWRMFFVVFTGECRASPEVQAHIHESPPSMAVPLAVLGILALVGGWVGWPHGLGGSDRFHGFLAPLIEPGRHLVLQWQQELIPMVFALAVSLAGFGVAWWIYYARRNVLPQRLAQGALGTIHAAAASGWQVDRLYDFIVVWPVRNLSWLLHRVVDFFLIDLVLVNGVGFLTTFSGRMLRFFQNGQVQRYAVGMIIGLACILFYLLV